MKALRNQVVASLEKWCPPALDLVRVAAHRQFELWPLRRVYAQPALHNFIRSRFSEVRGGMFLEAGANDGVRQSNTAYLERYANWTGILVEPIPHRFVDCLRNRPSAIVEHCALVSRESGDSFVSLQFNDLMSAVSRQLDSPSQGLTGSGLRLTGQKFLAPARTLDSVLKAHGDPVVDLFSLDVEGFELQVLKGLTLEERHIRTMLIECWDFPAVRDYLASFGYRHEAHVFGNDHFFVADELQRDADVMNRRAES